MSQPFPAVVELFLAFAFAFACWWVKRNPSNFLRFALFPFGGINVERWPRILLWIVRACAILGFFSFVLAFLDGLLLTDKRDSSPALLYTKFGVAILVSFLALRGSSEELPERASSSRATSLTNKPHFLMPAIPKTQSSSATSSFEPGSPRLSDVEAPPVPNRVYPLSAPPEEVVQRRMAQARSSVLLGLGWATFSFVIGATGVAIFFVVLFVLAAGLQVYTRNVPVAICPFCGEVILRYKKLRPEPFRCPHCWEYSQLTFGLVTPVNPSGPQAVLEKPFFLSPAFENAVWPSGCVLCGAPPTRFDEATGLRYQYRRLAIRFSAFVLPHPAARVQGIPYCERHHDAIQVIPPKEMFGWSPMDYLPGYAERLAEKRLAFLRWRSLPMMRRYLEANRQAKSTVSKGYRAPNLFQRIVSAPFSGARPGTPPPGLAGKASRKTGL